MALSETAGPVNWLGTARSRSAARAGLICFSPAGAGSAAYRGWADAAPSDIEVLTVQLPGRESRIREQPVNSLGELLPRLLQGISPGLNRPFAFFGHSLGSTIAFEATRELRRLGAPLPMALFVSASRAPQLPWPHPPVRQLDDRALLVEIHRRYASVPDVILEDAELRELLTPMLRADMTMVETYGYRDEPPLSIPIAAFGGDRDPMVAVPDLEAWASQTTADFALRMVNGAHLYLESRRAELLDAVVATLRAIDDRRLASSAGR